MKTVWYNEKQEKNSYAEFITRFTYSGKTCKLRISASSEYAVYLNGEFVCNGQYPDYPFYKVADEIDLTARVRSGENLLAVAAYHDGLNNSSVYYPKPAGVAYEVVADGKVLAESDDTTFARRSPVFGSGEIENITNQLGYSYRADLRRADEWITTGAGDGFAPAVVTVPDYDFQPRPIKKCELLSPAKTTAVQQGFFVEHGGDIPSLKMQNALLGFKRFSDMTGKEKIGFADKPNTFTCADGDGKFLLRGIGFVLFVYKERRKARSARVFACYGSIRRRRSRKIEKDSGNACEKRRARYALHACGVVVLLRRDYSLRPQRA